MVLPMRSLGLTYEGAVGSTIAMLARLYGLVEDGLTDLDDLLRDRIAALKAERDRAKAALERAKTSQCPKFKLIRPWSNASAV